MMIADHISSDRQSKIFEKKKKKKKKKLRARFGSSGSKPGPKFVFRDFLEFGSNVFLEIAYDDILRQCLTSSRGKNHEKTLMFFAIFSSFRH